MNRIEIIKSYSDNIASMIVSSKQKFEEVIADKSIPLNERWDLFCSVIPAFKNHGDWAVYPELDIEGLDVFCWYSNYNKERHETVNTVSWVDLIVEKDDKCLNHLEKLDEIKEWILKNNLGSFQFDW